MSFCAGTRITTMKQYEQLSRKLRKDLLDMKQIMVQEAREIEYMAQVCTDTLAQEPNVPCDNCGSKNTENRMGVMYERFRCRQTAHTPYYSVCNDCGKVITPTQEQTLTLAHFVLNHKTRYNPDNVAEAVYYIFKHQPQTQEQEPPQNAAN